MNPLLKWFTEPFKKYYIIPFACLSIKLLKFFLWLARYSSFDQLVSSAALLFLFLFNFT